MLHDRQLFRSTTELARPTCEPVPKAKLERTHSEPVPHTTRPKFGEGQHDVAEMIRYVAKSAYIVWSVVCMPDCQGSVVVTTQLVCVLQESV